MDNFTRSISGYPLGGFSAIIMTAILFTALPLLTKIQISKPPNGSTEYVLIDTRKPPPPPQVDPEPSKQQEMLQKDPPETIERDRRTRPKINMPKTSLSDIRGGMGRIAIRMDTEFDPIDKRRFVYNPNEVDQPPRYLRTFQPQYPYLAKRDNVEGSVKLRFLVDVDGCAKEAEVVEAEPEGFFEEAALKAIARYKFKPAVKDGESVMCSASLTITFELD